MKYLFFSIILLFLKCNKIEEVGKPQEETGSAKTPDSILDTLCNKIIVDDTNFSFKDLVEQSILNKKDKYGLKDLKTFLSYLPDTLDFIYSADSLLGIKIANKIISKLPDLAKSYQKYDLHINRKGSSGVIYGANEYLTTEWSFNSNYIKPKNCLGWDTTNVCWSLPSDFTRIKTDVLITGMPYCWGGRDVFRTFVDKVADGFAPGDICGSDYCKKLCKCEVTKPICENKVTAGIDCSGLVINSFGISKYHATGPPNMSTSDLATKGKFNWIGKDIRNLKRGDILIYPKVHVGICTYIDLSSNLCEIIHASPHNFFEVGSKIDGLNQGVRLDRGSIAALQVKLNSGFGIYRYAYKNNTYMDYQIALSDLLAGFNIQY